ncbi:insulinase family protein [Clostridium botulinum]|uniref:Peptidase M16 n=1 Tax=Clostridium botulinum C/D str. DC5 TaxID=1443128 RepID=A0A0A0IFW6_CLOBO|nr:pitrilysin family protein [Clostridium botulinum]KEI01593.1 peptidase M16 [Clostridium botulinum C/D str. BKT75002]KEI07927.1 peptidase M16 [Clostridium botulinum C/D str. BKT2873]KGN00345.1 peptidase M16 [Clostridium botulinum C/D str. DC5]KOC51351.1 peptidase M16 [Clostridium botulinum]KOC53715.1 peptidase M16 [Clostridium botulinum]
MIKYILENGVQLYYVKRQGHISSFCIGFNAGALVENKREIGIAHAVEHMVFKGTRTRSEDEINKMLDKIFGFNNAMTNYPYVIYYGTTLSSDFHKGFQLYSDIVMNPSFAKDGFEEEINVILEELKEWKDDPYQECEDELFFNAFNKRRIKELIIGNKESIENITLNDIKHFYNKHYTPENCVISVVSSLEFHEVLKIVNDNFGAWKNHYKVKIEDIYDKNVPGVFYKIRKDLNGAKIQYCFPIHNLSKEEIEALKIFNFKFGEGTSSILFDEIRTKNGMAYDISSSIKSEKGIKLFVITLGTSEDKVDKAMDLINKSICSIKSIKGMFNENNIKDIIKSINLKKELALEKSIELCKKITTNKIMFNSTDDIFNEFMNDKFMDEKKIIDTACKVLKKPSIQILKP